MTKKIQKKKHKNNQNTRASRKFSNILVVCALFFKLWQKQSNIQSRCHRVAPFEASFLPILWFHTNISSCLLRWETLLVKLAPSLGCWSITNPWSEPGIRTNTNPTELVLDYKLVVVSVWFLQVPGGGSSLCNGMDCGIVVSEFVLQSRCYVHFRANTLGKGMNPLILPAMD